MGALTRARRLSAGNKNRLLRRRFAVTALARRQP